MLIADSHRRMPVAFVGSFMRMIANMPVPVNVFFTFSVYYFPLYPVFFSLFYASGQQVYRGCCSCTRVLWLCFLWLSFGSDFSVDGMRVCGVPYFAILYCHLLK